MRDHLLRTSGLAWFAYCSARKLAAKHCGLKHAQQAVLSNIVAAYFLRKRKEAIYRNIIQYQRLPHSWVPIRVPTFRVPTSPLPLAVGELAVSGNLLVFVAGPLPQ